jgi:peptide/nickel transport system permease protein
MREAAAVPVRAQQVEREARAAPGWRVLAGRLRQYSAGLVVLLFVLVAIFGPALFPYDPLVINLMDRLRPPGAELADGSRTWLGTDQVGTDVLAQVVQGARISLLVGGATITIAGISGLLIGVIAGYFGGFLDALLMRIADVQLAFPSILFAILIASVLGPSVLNVIITLSITRWVIFARVARSSTLVSRERDFVVAARSLGATNRQLLTRHIVPFTVAPFLILLTLEMGLAIIAEASLSFLGLGTPPEQPSWGLTIANGRDYLATAWWVTTMPGIALSILVVSLGLLGDQLRRSLDPRSGTRRDVKLADATS